MATITGLINARIEARGTMTLTEAEMRALVAIACYGPDAFVRAFYSQLGEAYLKPNEGGLRSLFRSIDAQVPSLLRRVDKAREAFNREANS